jgi:hypothetical protein
MRRVVITAGGLFFLLLALAPLAMAQGPFPPTPATFSGKAEGAASGGHVVALVTKQSKTTTCGSGSVYTGPGLAVVYTIEVAPAAQRPGCGSPGDEVFFYFPPHAGRPGYLAGTAGTWGFGPRPLDLVVGSLTVTPRRRLPLLAADLVPPPLMGQPVAPPTVTPIPAPTLGCTQAEVQYAVSKAVAMQMLVTRMEAVADDLEIWSEFPTNSNAVRIQTNASSAAAAATGVVAVQPPSGSPWKPWNDAVDSAMRKYAEGFALLSQAFTPLNPGKLDQATDAILAGTALLESAPEIGVNCAGSTPPLPVAPPAANTSPAGTSTVTPNGGCHPSYPTLCLPAAPPDLDCGDIPNRNFPVLPPDPHRLDGNDNDGLGCET